MVKKKTVVKTAKKKVVKKKVAKRKIAKKKTARRPTDRNKNGLNSLEQSYADHYILLGSKMEAYKASATKKVTSSTAKSAGCRMHKRKPVLDYINNRTEEIQAKAQYSQQDWFDDLLLIKGMAMGIIPIPSSMKYEGAVIQLPSVMEFDGSAANKVMDMLGKSKVLDTFADKTHKVEMDASDDLTKILAMVTPTLGPPSERKK